MDVRPAGRRETVRGGIVARQGVFIRVVARVGDLPGVRLARVQVDGVLVIPRAEGVGLDDQAARFLDLLVLALLVPGDDLRVRQKVVRPRTVDQEIVPLIGRLPADSVIQ